MANIYYGCVSTTSGGAGTPPTLDGNWNTAANWFLTTGSGPAGCCCAVAAVPAGRVPSTVLGDTVILFGGASVAAHNNITTGPTGGWSGALSWYSSSSGAVSPSPCQIQAGTYSGTVTIVPPLINYSPVTETGINGGTFSGTVNLSASALANNCGTNQKNGIFGGTFTSASAVHLTGGDTTAPSTTSGYGIFGGTFNGSVTRTVSEGARRNYILGGTYSPSATMTVSGTLLNDAGLPVDPGFAIGGGTFSPVITISNVADILGAGLPV